MSLGQWLLPAFITGVLGAGHCLGMCGGIAAFLGIQGRWQQSLLYQLGRIGSYSLLGLAAGSAASLLPSSAGIPLRILAGVLLILMGLYLLSWKQGLLWLERLGGRFIFKPLRPLSQRLSVPRSPGQTLAAGFVWGLLPCGLVYSALGLAASSGQAGLGSLIMLAFGLGTLPLMLMVSLLGQQSLQLIRAPWVRRFSGLLVIGFGLWTLWLPLKHLLNG